MVRDFDRRFGHLISAYQQAIAHDGVITSTAGGREDGGRPGEGGGPSVAAVIHFPERSAQHDRNSPAARAQRR